MLRRLLFGGAGARAMGAAMSARTTTPSTQPMKATTALLSTRAALQPLRPATPPTRPALGEDQQVAVLKALQKLFLPRPTTTKPLQPPQQLPPTQPQPQPQQPPQAGTFECMNRNARRGKKANHGKRAVSSARRKYKRKIFGKK